MKCKDYRRIASNKCELKSGLLALITLIYVSISGGISFVSFNLGDNENYILLIVMSILAICASFLSAFYIGPLYLGYSQVIVKNANRLEFNVGDLFKGFLNYWNAVCLTLLITVYTFLWTLLLFVPGIIKGLSYSMSYYIYIDNPTLTAKECITKSKEMMKGYKAKLFRLQLSYIGWQILCVLTFGVLTLWVEPKINTAVYTLYQNIKKEKTI